MTTIQQNLRRREFLKRATQAAAAVTAGDALRLDGATAESAARPSSAIPTRKLGKTGLELPILGYGGAALPQAWGNPLSRADRVALVRYACDRGLRYFDTGPGYFESQAILGEALKDRRRDLCLVTKVDTTRPEEVRPMVESSLKTLQTDYLDILLVHGTPGIQQMTLPQAMKIHAQLVKLRDERITRFIGLSAHGYFDKALALIRTGGFDQCMLACGYIPRGYDQIWTARMTALRDACLARAHELGMGIVAMKVIAAGMLGAWSGHLVRGFDKRRLGQLPGAAIRHVLQDSRIHLLNIGMRLKEEIDANLHCLTGDTAFTPQDRGLLADFAASLYDTDAIRQLKTE